MRVLLPLPDRDFDVTEVAVPWAILREAGHDVVFAAKRGRGAGRAGAPGRAVRARPRTVTARGTATDDTAAFAVQDRNYVSARWPGDAYLFGRRFCALLAPRA
jgi:putative intracellular protease/amidase